MRVMSQGMVRPAWLVAVIVALAMPARAASNVPGRMGMYTPQGAALVMQDSKIVVHVRGPIAEATVTQTFRNDSDRVLEATYIFPLPADAAVSAMEIETGSRTIHAAIEAREQAQERYENAIAAGTGAALLDQERPDVFTQSVAAIPAKGTVVVTLRFDTVARYQDGHWELALPMVVAPRYVPGSATGRPTTGTGRAPDTDRSPDASRVTPGGAPGAGGKTEVVVEYGDAVEDVTSPTHDLAKTKTGYAFTDAKSDHDAIVRWRAKVPMAGWVEKSDDGGFAAVMVEAPAAAPRKGALRVLLVLDRAATTRGDADAVERPVVRALLTALDAKDRIAVTGSSSIDWHAPDRVLRTLDDSWTRAAGPFDLTKVLAQARSDGAPLVLVTDGLVADDRAALAAAGKLGVPIHVIAIGPAPNRGLLAQLAAATGGTVRFAAIGDDPAALARDVLADAASPPEALTINWGTLAASDVVPATLPRLGAGQATLVVAKVKHVQTANARVRGDVFGFVSVPAARPPEGATTTRGTLARRWAKLTLDELIATGNAKAITEHALHYGLVSPYTSMVAIGDEVVVQGGVKHTVPVAVSVPEGMRWQLVKKEITIEINGRAPTIDQGTLKAPTTVATKTDKNEKKNIPPAKHRPTKEHKPVEKVPVPAEPRSPVAGTTPAQPAQPDRGAAVGGEAGEEEPVKQETQKGAIDEERLENVPKAAPPPATATAEGGADYDAEDTGAEVEVLSSPRRRARLSLALGAGIAVTNGDAAPLAAVTGRVDFGYRTRLGFEGALWVVDGLHGQGNVLGVVSRSIARRLELGAGAGLRVTGSAAGPSFNVTLRTTLARHLATYLRYDGALLLHDQTRDGQNAVSAGMEARF